MALQTKRIYTNYQNYTAFYLDWSEESTNQGGNYSKMSWRVGIRASGANVSWYSNSVKILSSNLGGNGLTTGTWSNINLTNGQSYQLGSGNFNYGHNSNGTGSISGSIKGWLYANGDSTTASGSMTLTPIPRYATINSTSGNINDDTSNVYINYSNPAGGSITAYMYVRPGTSGSWTLVASRGSYSSGADFSLSSGERETARAALANTNSGQVLYRVTNSVGNTDSVSTFTIVSANPTFTTYTYKDNNSTMAALTGSDQVIVQDPGGLTNPTSSLLVTIASANKAVANKEASMVDYLVTLGAYSDPAAYSPSSDVTKTVGAIALSGAQTLQVRARDSRGNYTQVDTGLTVLPYAMPVVNAHLSRSNSFDAAVRLTFDSIQISSITVGGVDKNGVKSTATGTANRVEYRYKTNAGAYGSWVDRTASVAAGSGGVAAVTVAALDIVAAPTANNTYTAQVRVTDKLGNATVLTIYLGSGQPIFRIGTDTKIYNNEVQVMPTVNDATLVDSSILANTASTPTRKNVKDYVDAATTPNLIPYTSSATWSKPAGLKFIIVEVVGGGGAGGFAPATSGGGSLGSGGGGGGGGYSRKRIMAADLASTVTITVGAGGVATTSAAPSGGTSSFGSHLSASGGGGGDSGTANDQATTGGAGGIGANGDLNLSGEAGTNCWRGTARTFGGTGGSSQLGGGGRNTSGGTTNGSNQGEDGGIYGGGGAGSGNSNTQSARRGGHGAGGIVLVWEYF